MLVPPAHDKPQLITCDVGSQSVRTEGAALQTMGGEKEARGEEARRVCCYLLDAVGRMVTCALESYPILVFLLFLPSFLSKRLDGSLFLSFSAFSVFLS